LKFWDTKGKAKKGTQNPPSLAEVTVRFRPPAPYRIPDSSVFKAFENICFWIPQATFSQYF